VFNAGFVATIAVYLLARSDIAVCVKMWMDIWKGFLPATENCRGTMTHCPPIASLTGSAREEPGPGIRTMHAAKGLRLATTI
jgi:hypothetical protein